MSIISSIISWITGNYTRTLIFFIALMIISPGIYFIGMLTIFFGWGIIAFILQWLILFIEIPANTIIEFINLLLGIFGQSGFGTIDLNIDGEETSLWYLSTGISFLSPDTILFTSWYPGFTTNGEINWLKMFLPFYLEWI